ncbi:melatonin receptor type 1B-A-like [Montipora capricornis]|uniref:melatonin receptor type 1B-A-like n=1 Tax=Montipora capricornis TaxID=246305 RepID=UPI0035F1F1BA
MASVLQSRNVFIVVVEVSALIVLNLLSLMGNTLVCMSVYRNIGLRTTTNLYIIALAISDLLSAVFVMPFVTAVLASGHWIFGEVICNVLAFFSAFIIYVSPVTMGLTALNRYVRMCRPDREYQRFFSTKKSLTLLVSVWVIVACYSGLPNIVGLRKNTFFPNIASCAIDHLSESGRLIHYCIVVSLFLLTPLTITIFSYVKVAKKIQHHKTEISFLRQNSPIISAREIRISKSLFVVVFAFMICWIPLWIIVLLMRFHLVEKLPRNVKLLSFFFLYLSNTINPLIYAGMNRCFRREFRKIICERKKKVPDRITNETPQINTNNVPQELDERHLGNFTISNALSVDHDKKE